MIKEFLRKAPSQGVERRIFLQKTINVIWHQPTGSIATGCSSHVPIENGMIPFAAYTAKQTRCFSVGRKTPEIAPFHGRYRSNLMSWFNWAHKNQPSNRHLDQFSRFSTANPCDQQTGTQTTLRATSVATGRISCSAWDAAYKLHQADGSFTWRCLWNGAFSDTPATPLWPEWTRTGNVCQDLHTPKSLAGLPSARGAASAAVCRT